LVCKSNSSSSSFLWRLAPVAPIIYKYGLQPTDKMRREIQNPQVFHQHVSLSPERCTLAVYCIQQRLYTSVLHTTTLIYQCIAYNNDYIPVYCIHQRLLQKLCFSSRKSLSQLFRALKSTSVVPGSVLFIYSAKARLRGKTHFCLGI
jgi:hypothetical protein